MASITKSVVSSDPSWISAREVTLVVLVRIKIIEVPVYWGVIRKRVTLPAIRPPRIKNKIKIFSFLKSSPAISRRSISISSSVCIMCCSSIDILLCSYFPGPGGGIFRGTHKKRKVSLSFDPATEAV